MREEDQKLVPSAVEMSDFSLWRSLRRGAVLETTTHKVDVQVIELINRWRKKEAARGSEAGLPMRQVYTQVRSLRGLKTGAPAVGPRSLSNSVLGLAPTSTLDHLPFHPVEVVKED